MRAILACLALSLALPFTAAASGDNSADPKRIQPEPQTDELQASDAEAEADAFDADDIVRLPGQLTARPDKIHLPGGDPDKPKRLVPGGVLIVSFDTNGDGIISPEELNTGITAAFAQADANGDGQLTALEQQAWAASLPVRDDTLANPVRFDPNLDRIVTFEEFRGVIYQLAATYQDSAGEIAVASLTAPDKPEREDRRLAEGGLPPGEGGPGMPRR